MKLLGIDIGTTHCKAGLFEADGLPVRIARRRTIAHKDSNGYFYYNPEEIWNNVVDAIKEVVSDVGTKDVAAIGVTSMAESGLLVDKKTGVPCSPFIPWFDTRSMKQAETIGRQVDKFACFCKTGLHLSFKYGLPKLLWIKQNNAGIFDNTVWLSASDYIVYRLTGEFATDYSLAARNYVFQIDKKTWDDDLIRYFGFQPELFPKAVQGGIPVGGVNLDGYNAVGIKQGTPVAIAGHDHVCAALAVGAVKPGLVMDSIGTAETLVGAIEERKLGKTEYNSGLCYGCHVVKDRHFWMGATPASGGSIEWLRAQMSEELLSYEKIEKLIAQAVKEPTGILYFPYLSGSGAPMPNSGMQGALIGLKKSHSRADILKAIMEGTAYEMEWIRKTAEQATDSIIEKIIAVGGGTRDKNWMQIKADVSGCSFEVLPFPEATLLGAAMAAGIGCELYSSEEEAISYIDRQGSETFTPDNTRHEGYHYLFERGYLALQGTLRQHYENLVEG